MSLCQIHCRPVVVNTTLIMYQSSEMWALNLGQNMTNSLIITKISWSMGTLGNTWQYSEDSKVKAKRTPLSLSLTVALNYNPWHTHTQHFQSSTLLLRTSWSEFSLFGHSLFVFPSGCKAGNVSVNLNSSLSEREPWVLTVRKGEDGVDAKIQSWQALQGGQLILGVFSGGGPATTHHTAGVNPAVTLNTAASLGLRVDKTKRFVDHVKFSCEDLYSYIKTTVKFMLICRINFYNLMHHKREVSQHFPLTSLWQYTCNFHMVLI